MSVDTKGNGYFSGMINAKSGYIGNFIVDGKITGFTDAGISLYDQDATQPRTSGAKIDIDDGKIVCKRWNTYDFDLLSDDLSQTVTISNEGLFVKNEENNGNYLLSISNFNNSININCKEISINGKLKGSAFQWKSKRVTGNTLLDTSDIFDSANEIIVQVNENSTGNYYTYTWNVVPDSIGIGNGNHLIDGYQWGNVYGMARVRLGRSSAQLLNCIVGNTDYIDNSALTIYYR